MQDYTLIQGYPGSGKSSTIAFVARMLACQGKRVLITAYTHSAVDNCLLKLMEAGCAEPLTDNRPPSMVRIGDKSSVHPGVQNLLLTRVASQLEKCEDIDTPSAESLRRVLKESRIVGATALKIPKSLLVGEHFDVVIVDEAGQISQPAVLGALASADKFVLVGDHLQLPPLVISEAALEGGKK
jgi:DNA replication ATP-dependent helicase Dna2